jgi:pyrroline-5-carboxylate reductase
MLKIGFLGGGKMAQALANGMISGGEISLKTFN